MHLTFCLSFYPHLPHQVIYSYSFMVWTGEVDRADKIFLKAHPGLKYTATVITTTTTSISLLLLLLLVIK